MPLILFSGSSPLPRASAKSDIDIRLAYSQMYTHCKISRREGVVFFLFAERYYFPI